MSWKEKKLRFLDICYGSEAFLWRKELSQLTDDRVVYVNIYYMMVKAINSLPDEPVNYVRVAMNSAIQEDCETLDRIRCMFSIG